MAKFGIGSIIKVKLTIGNEVGDLEDESVEIHIKFYNNDPVTKDRKSVEVEKHELVIADHDLYAFVDTTNLATGDLWAMLTIKYPDPRMQNKHLKELQVIKIEGVQLVEI